MAFIDRIKGLVGRQEPVNLDNRVEPKVMAGVEKKSASVFIDAPFSFADFLLGGGKSDVLAVECIRLYTECAPLFNAINLRAESFASMPIRVYDTVEREFVDDHPVLDLLKSPNPVQSSVEFLKSFSSFYDITGETFMIATGDRGSEPLELYVANPTDFTIETSRQIGSAGFAGEYRHYTISGSATFKIDEDEIGGSFRYWNMSGDQELLHVRDFNPKSSTNNLRGLPRAKPHWLQIQQFIEADTNNLSILKRGGRPSLAWIWKHTEPMTDDQYQRFRQEVKAYEGAINAGRQAVLDNMELQDIGANNKEMQFAENRKTVREDVYTAYGIPLSIISSDSMTLDNLKTGSLMLYDNAVVPLATSLYASLTRFLMPRFPDSENLILTYSSSDIPALRQRLIDEANSQSELNVLTDNELRSEIGFEPIQGGDTVYKPSNLLPAGTDTFTEDQPERPRRQRRAFFENMRGVKTAGGERAFTDEQIACMADEHGL